MSEKEPLLKSHRRPGVETTVVAAADVRFGDGAFPVLAGPGSVESEDQIMAAATAISEAGGLVLRSATYLPDDLAGSSAPLGEEGLWLLEHASRATGLATSTFVFEPAQVLPAAEHVDILEIGPSRMRDEALLSSAGQSGLPVIVHRGAASTIDEWLVAADRVLSGGSAAILCERGSDGFDPRTSGTVDISAVAVVQRMSHLPVLVNPAPTVGSLDLIGPLALAARVAGADGLMVAVHPSPDTAGFRSGGHLDLDAFAALMDGLGIPSLRDEIDRIDRELLKLIARRLRSSVGIGQIKASQDLPMESPSREAELVAEARADAEGLGLDPDYIEDVMRVVLRYSKDAQRNTTDGG
jgi:3-deoxy-7-phosphoheptulonate synthase/chorismate mutase-like protein